MTTWTRISPFVIGIAAVVHAFLVYETVAAYFPEALPFFVLLLGITLPQAVYAIRGRSTTKWLVIGARILCVPAAFYCILFAAQDISFIIESFIPPHESTLRTSGMAFGNSMLLFLFAVPRAFLSDHRPLPTLIFGFALLVTTRLVSWFDIKLWLLVFFAIYVTILIRMILADLSILGIDIGRRKESNQLVKTRTTSGPV